jgi:putative transposase
VHDRRPAGEREKFSSAILPPYLRKTRSIEELIPWLYLKGVSTGDFNGWRASLRETRYPPQKKGRNP